MRTKLGNLCMVIGTALILGALYLFLSNQAETEQAERASAEVMPELIEQIQQVQEEEPPEQTWEIPEVPVELLTEEERKMTEKVIYGRRYIGYLGIPVLELELPILSQWTYPDLQVSPARYYGSVKGEDLVLLAHNYPKHFGKISTLTEGDRITFTDMDGEVWEYEVVNKDIVDPYAVEEVISGDYDLTLFTCTYGGKSRVTVYCDRIKE